jgi:hypothetical protein
VRLCVSGLRQLRSPAALASPGPLGTCAAAEGGGGCSTTTTTTRPPSLAAALAAALHARAARREAPPLPCLGCLRPCVLLLTPPLLLNPPGPPRPSPLNPPMPSPAVRTAWLAWSGVGPRPKPPGPRPGDTPRLWMAWLRLRRGAKYCITERLRGGRKAVTGERVVSAVVTARQTPSASASRTNASFAAAAAATAAAAAAFPCGALAIALAPAPASPPPSSGRPVSPRPCVTAAGPVETDPVAGPVVAAGGAADAGGGDDCCPYPLLATPERSLERPDTLLLLTENDE